MNNYNLLDFILHRPPFLFVDSILDLSDEYVRTQRTITVGDYLIVSGTYVIENMAQSAAALFGYRNRNQKKKCNHMYLASIESAQVERSLREGEILVTEVRVILAIGNWGRVECESFVEMGEKREYVANGTLTLYID